RSRNATRVPKSQRPCASPFSQLKEMSRHPPLRQAPRLVSLAACGRFGEALDPLARHHHPPPFAALPTCPMTGPILTSNPCRSRPTDPSRGPEKITIPQRLDPSAVILSAKVL